jgi:Xaa-Pro aminopeptidase
MSFEARIERVRARAEDAGVDALLVTNLTNVRYLTGFSGTNGQVLVGRDGAVFMSDPRYAARASDLVQGAEVLIYPARLTDVLVERLARAEVQRLGIEAKTMTVAARDELAAKLGGPGGRRARTPNPREQGAVEVVSTSAIVEDERRSKDAAEVALMREAARLADDAFEWILDRLTPGRTETEIALDLEMRVRRQGADDVSFDPIVGTGSLSAHIHHTPSGRALQRGDLVLLDFGAQVDGYCSDLTRTVILGEASEEHRSLYTRLLEAQAAGIAALEPGAAGAEVDRAARSVVDAAGDGDSFGHGLGHGVGLDIHEAPRLHWESRDTLAVGDVVTVEPGVYRVGWGGIRIEDCVLVTETGCEVLSSAPKKELIEL